MYKFASKVFYGVLTLLFLNNLAFGIDAEFKNSLLKIELIKTSENTYNVDLYTKNQFLEPVKVIKKSDLNYYILLPETKNESTRTTTSGSEIRDIATNVYPYAGQDINNGYVKISINTTKPLIFKVNIKNALAAAKITSETEEVALKPDKANIIEEKVETKTQKKNSASSTEDSPKNKIKEVVASKISRKEVVKEPQRMTIEDAVRKEIERVRQEQLEQMQNDDFVDEQNQVEEQEITEPNEDESSLTSEDLNEIEQIAKELDKGNGSFFAEVKNKLNEVLTQYNIGAGNFVLVGIIFVLAFLLMLVLLTKRKTNKIGIKSKVELNLASCIPNFKKESKADVKNDGQYFIFDKNIKQTGFYDPATSAIKKNYELSTYEPELKNKYNRNVASKKANQSEYDIIQKILKEDSFIDLPSGSMEQQVHTKGLNLANDVQAQQQALQQQRAAQQQKEIAQKQQEQVIEKPTPIEVEPDVISNVEIAPQRGFMLVSYNENINLLGYIFDDVFPLYNFKAPKLENYDIKFRLSEKDDKIARFIVKVGNTKMLVAVSKSSMAMEVLL